jgi:dipeptidyl aminopeptidase/acylaminoacyl peptidase
MEGFTTSAMQVFSQLVLTVGALGGALLLVVYLLQDKILYVPNVENLRHHYLKPEQFGLYAWEDLYLKTPDGETIQIWFFKLVNGSSTAPTFLYFHGNAGSTYLHFRWSVLFFPPPVTICVYAFVMQISAIDFHTFATCYDKRR